MTPSTILAFGYHDQASPRHRSVCDALKAQGGRVIECHTDVKGFLPKCRDLAKKYRTFRLEADTVLVPFPGQYLMPLAWWLTRRARRRLLFDAFFSLHDTAVHDRQTIREWHPKAWGLWLVDWLSCRLADEIFIDTEAHRRWFIDQFHIRPDRIRVIYLDARKDLFFPDPERARKNPVPEIFFYGTYIPLQGIDHILGAAKILQERGHPAHFTLVGNGQTYGTMQERARSLGLRNVAFRSFVPLQELPDLIHASDLCLGIFGTSGKAARVIPHKVYDAVACGVPVLTADTPAIRERFASHPLVTLCPAGDAEAIAGAIMRHFPTPHANTAV